MIINSRSLKLCSSTDYVVRPSTGDERQVFQIQVCVCDHKSFVYPFIIIYLSLGTF